jgi:predicted ATPase with chaperone activity
LNTRLLRRYCTIDAASENLLETAITRMGLSARARNRILKVARTIADRRQHPPSPAGTSAASQVHQEMSCAARAMHLCCHQQPPATE